LLIGPEAENRNLNPIKQLIRILPEQIMGVAVITIMVNDSDAYNGDDDNGDNKSNVAADDDDDHNDDDDDNNC